MRFIIVTVVSMLTVAITALLMYRLFNQPMVIDNTEEQPDVVFYDKINIQNNQACQQAHKDINNYLKQPENSCQNDQDCHFYNYGLPCTVGTAVNVNGLKKINKLEEIVTENCVSTHTLQSLCIQSLAYSYLPACINQQCIRMPVINEALMRKQIHDTKRYLQNPTH